MWIVILNFSLFVLLLCFMFYGLSKWTELIGETDLDESKIIHDGFYTRLPVWILILGFGAYSLISDIVQFFAN